jgi:coproporphyrinogen III oxidase-like Fe-S oxidoreductase
LSDEDRRRRAKIFDLMTKFDVHLDAREAADAPRALDSLVHDGLVSVDGATLSVPVDGRPFLRNVATFFDEYYGHENTKGPTYSTSA